MHHRSVIFSWKRRRRRKISTEIIATLGFNIIVEPFVLQSIFYVRLAGEKRNPRKESSEMRDLPLTETLMDRIWIAAACRVADREILLLFKPSLCRDGLLFIFTHSASSRNLLLKLLFPGFH